MRTFDLVEETVSLEPRALTIVRPRSAEDLLDEGAFEREELLPYWAELWPSGIALARLVGGRAVAGHRVLELGCGLALPSLAAALAGARVVATDWSVDALRLAQLNAARNGASLETRLLPWGDWEAAGAAGRFDLVLAADVLYERRNVPQLAALLPLLVAADGEALVADPGRRHAPAFVEACTGRWRVELLRATELPRGGVFRLRSA